MNFYQKYNNDKNQLIGLNMKLTIRLVQILITISLCGHYTAQAFCGFYAGKADSSLYNHASQVILARDGNKTVLTMLNDYKGPANEFALIIPTPVTLKQGQVRIANPKIFDRLDEYSSPRLVEYQDDNPCDPQLKWGYEKPVIMFSTIPVPSPNIKKDNKALGVVVEEQYTLEEYDIVSLSAKESDGLETWLIQNGYHIPQGTSAALLPYIKQGMKFFVAKVNLQEQKRLGFQYLRPLQFAFESEKFMLPMRLGMLNAQPNTEQDLIVYALSKNSRIESSNYANIKVPSEINIPASVKNRFGDFYKAVFDKVSLKENYKAVFTEYFWNTAWCDPCSGKPLENTELRDAGVFWQGGRSDENFIALTTPGNSIKAFVPPKGLNTEVSLTRLHLRYNAKSLPEDLLLTPTQDRQNWQVRYIIQNSAAGSVSQCSYDMSQIACKSFCSQRIKAINNKVNLFPGMRINYAISKLSEDEKIDLCFSDCNKTKINLLNKAKSYYEQTLPKRLALEKENLEKLTGWRN